MFPQDEDELIFITNIRNAMYVPYGVIFGVLFLHLPDWSHGHGIRLQSDQTVSELCLQESYTKYHVVKFQRYHIGYAAILNTN